MKFPQAIYKVSIFVIVSISFFIPRDVLAMDRIAEINRAIAEKGANWTAGENWVTRLEPEERKKLYGANLKPPDPSLAKIVPLPKIANLPEAFDWRDNNGNWVTPVRNQGGCGSCWAFSAVAQVESWWAIAEGVVDPALDLSEQFLLSCSEGGCDGWGVDSALAFIQRTRIPTEACFSYQADDEIPCSDACTDWRDKSTGIPGFGFITLDEDIIDNIKSAVYRHPVSAIYRVYEDFDAYNGGVYEHVWGEYEAGHAVLIVGWNDEEQSWICKNSWGEYWGLDGYFRIRWGQCDIGKYMPFIYADMSGDATIAVSPDTIEFSLTVGDSSAEEITVRNDGTAVLEYTSIDLGVRRDVFRPSYFNAYEGLSWWCGDPALDGYDNRCLEYLDTPVLDLSKTGTPLLSFMGFWALGDTAGAEFPYDGFDGCNVWISTDGGEHFKVARPNYPDYTCGGLKSFGLQSLGISVDGWSTFSDGWVPVEFDLAEYKSDSTVIRFAFASDATICTRHDPALLGFFVDDILIADGDSVLFEDDGENVYSMTRTGVGKPLGRADWLSVIDGAGAIPPGDSTIVRLVIDSRELIQSSYMGAVRFMSNDTVRSTLDIPFYMELNAPEHDIIVGDVFPQDDTLLVIDPMNVRAKIKNFGQNDEKDFDVECRILLDGSEVFGDVIHIDHLAVGDNELVQFEPYLPPVAGFVEITVSLANTSDDYNPTNDVLQGYATITNTVDDFETESGMWVFEGGWGLSDRVPGHSGEFSVHCNGGESAYENDMDAYMTHIPGFDLDYVDVATLRYWAKSTTDRDKDVCYVEMSADSLNWIKVDSISGLKPAWTQHEVGFYEFDRLDSGRVWVRFHFISDESGTKLGIFIDDVEIYPEYRTDIAGEKIKDAPPVDWSLEQNYPNPFNPTTTIRYAVPGRCFVEIIVYDMLGREVKTLVSGERSAGYHDVVWDGTDDRGAKAASGIYFFTMKSGTFSRTRKLLLLK